MKRNPTFSLGTNIDKGGNNTGFMFGARRKERVKLVDIPAFGIQEKINNKVEEKPVYDFN